MLELFLFCSYVFVGIVLSMGTHIWFTYLETTPQYRNSYGPVNDRNWFCPFIFGIFWPLGLFGLVLMSVGNVYEFISKKVLSELEKFLKKEEK